MTFFMRILFLWILVAIESHVQAVTLGKLTFVSGEGDPFVATIALEISDTDIKNIDKFRVVEGDASTYEKFQLQPPLASDPFELSILTKQGREKSPVIEIKSKGPLTASTAGLFKDILIELSWPSGLVRRVYTILPDRDRSVKISDGDSLSQIAARLQPDMQGATFDQTLIALYRANPQAFFSGNIHRLKSSESLNIPSPEMAKSIPKGEAFNVTLEASKSYQDLLSSANKKSEVEKSINQQDRLKVGSSYADDELKKERTKHIEELIAQEKVLEDTKLRIAELEKNIADLKKIITKDQSSQKRDLPGLVQEYSILIVFLIVTGLLIFALVRVNRLTRTNIHHGLDAIKSGQSVSLKQLVQPNIKDDSDLTNRTFEEKTISASDIPLSAKKLFEGIDLDLTSTKKIHESSIKVFSYAQQKVKLNLAKSYLKIDDQMTAKLVLEEIINLENHASPDILQEARHLRSLILI